MGRRYGRRRTEGLTAIAAQLGFTFGPKGQVIPEWRRLRLFRWGGKQKRIEYVLRGRRGSAEVALFDFTIPSMSPDAGTAITRTVASFRMPGKAFPRFSLEPTSLIGRLPAWLLTPLGGVKFDSNPEFSRHFLVDSPDRKEAAIRALFTPELLNFVVSSDAAHEWAVEGEGEWLIAYRPAEQAEVMPDHYREFFDRAAAIADAFARASE